MTTTTTNKSTHRAGTRWVGMQSLERATAMATVLQAPDRIKTYRRHGCTSKHRTYNKFCCCAFKRAAWVSGEGPFALIAWCSIPTISLWPTREHAEAALADLGFCGGRCTGRHEVVMIVKG